MDIWHSSCTGEPYHEPYRNQFHFSPQKGWMNDINGVWYADGVYHLTYQADPDHLRAENIQWGHATSPDLLHWTQQPSVIVPGENSCGPAWSGTAVVDTQNTAGFGKDAVLLFFTDKQRGQCLVYSLDGGRHFAEYEQNPVVLLDNPTQDTTLNIYDQRDPKVFWYPPCACWVMMVFRDKQRRGDELLRSMQFYTSTDLKHWTRKKDFYHEKFYECPDVCCLPLDGDETNLKWVFLSASSYYALGSFDGESLQLEECPGEQLCQGPDIYAGQSFSNLPDGRVVSMYWMDNWHGSTVQTAPWTHSASFPTELALKTFPEGPRLVRNPIQEIAQLYTGAGEIWHQVIADATQNPLDGLYAQCFDLTIVLDMANTQAKEILLDIHGKQYTYCPATGTLYTLYTDTRERTIKRGAFYCMPTAETLKLRFLVDADSVELFVNDGRRTYTEEYGFSYVSKCLTLHADQAVPVFEIVFRPIGSIW